MSIEHPLRLRAEQALSPALREALRELPNVAPEPVQLEELRRQLGLAAATVKAPVRPVLVPDRRLKERRLRRTVVALVFFPVAATAAVGAVMDLHQRSVLSAAEGAASAARQAHNGTQRLSVEASPPPANTVDAPALSATVAPEDRAAPSAQDSAASLVRRPPAVPSSALGSGHAEPAPHPAEPSAPAVTELELLQRANAALRGDPAQALALTAQHRQLFPAGNLEQEREVIAIKAWVLLADRVHARESLSRFERAYPRSAHVLELRQIVH